MFEVIKQLVDFLVKAVLTYAATPEGQKEFADIERALENLQGPGEAPVSTSPSAVKSEVKIASAPAKGPRVSGGKR